MRIVSASAVGSPRKNFMKPASSSTLSSGLDAMVGEGERTTEGCRQTKRAGQEIWDASGETRRSGSKWVAALARPANHTPGPPPPLSVGSGSQVVQMERERISQFGFTIS